MSGLIGFILILILLSIIGILCSFLCILMDYKEEIWKIMKGEDNDDRF